MGRVLSVKKDVETGLKAGAKMQCVLIFFCFFFDGEYATDFDENKNICHIYLKSNNETPFVLASNQKF
jgi:hypothetical protein